MVTKLVSAPVVEPGLVFLQQREPSRLCIAFFSCQSYAENVGLKQINKQQQLQCWVFK